MSTNNPALDAISAFTANGDGTVTATTSFSETAFPALVTNPNVYVVGNQLYISGAETPANNGAYTITAINYGYLGLGTITYVNPNGVTQSGQFALFSAVPVLVKTPANSDTIMTTQPFAYTFSLATSSWNAPPAYVSDYSPTVVATGGAPIVTASTGTLNNTTLTITSGSSPNITGVTITYAPHAICNLVPYRFYLKITMPYLTGNILDDGTNYLSFDGGLTKCTIFNKYGVSSPIGIAVNHNATIIYVTDTYSNTIRTVDVSGGSEASLPIYGLSQPYGIALDEGNNWLYVSEFQTGNIRQVTTDGVENFPTMRAGSGSGRALGLALDTATQLLYIADANGSAIRVFNVSSRTEGSSLMLSAGARPQWLALDSVHSVIYYTDPTINGVGVYNLATNVQSTLASLPAITAPAGINFYYPGLIFCDTSTNNIYYINVSAAPGTINLLYGTGSPGNANGSGTSASFNAPIGIGGDANGNIYLADTGNKSIRPFYSDGSSAWTLAFSSIPTGYNAINVNGIVKLYPDNSVIYVAPLYDAFYQVIVTPTDSTPQTLTSSYVFPDGDGLFGLQLKICLTNLTSMPSLSFTYTRPQPIALSRRSVEPALLRSSTPSTSPLYPFITPATGTASTIQLSNATGFTYIPSPAAQPYSLQITSQTAAFPAITYERTLTITPIEITVTPSYISPLSLYTYAPFSYMFTIPSTLTDVTLDTTSSAPSLAPYVSTSADGTVVTFASTKPKTAASGNLIVRAYLSGSSDVQGSNETTVTISPTTIVVTPTILSGATLNLYKYEPFVYTFSILGTDSVLKLRYTNSSTQLAVYSALSSDSRTFTFGGTPPASYSETLSLVVDLMDGTTVASTTTYPVTISAGRITLLPSSPYALNQYENISNTFGSNILWSSSNAPDSIVSIPTLPYGLSFSSTAITGVPQTQQSQRNYQIIGSNSTNGRISTANIAISVGVPVVRVSPASASFAGLGIGSTPTATFTSLVPQTIYSSSFVYMWSPSLPDGLVFTDIGGNTLPNLPYYPPTSDTARTITLAGSPTMTDAAGFPSSGLVTVTLSGIYKDATNVQTTGTSTLALQFAETVLMTSNVSTSLYARKTLGSNDVTFTAASYFPSTSPIIDFSISALPAGLSVRNSGSNSWYLEGTPTVAGSIAAVATATNSHSITGSTPSFTIVINPDEVTFTLTPPSPTFIVSRALAADAFQVQAVSTSGAAITYTSSVNLVLYGLALNSVTGIVSGTPTASFSGTVIFTATDTWGASKSYTVVFTISPDTFLWPTYAPTYFQNRVIDPYQIVVTTASGRTIQSFSSTNMPAGLTLSPSGLITGTPTVSTGGTFTVTATTGYQAPPTASYSFTYTVIADNLLMVQVNGVDPISNAVFNAPFITIPYSTGTSVNPVYSFTTYPLQYPAPVFTVSQSGVLTGDFTGVPAPYSLYNAGITATYGGITNTTNVVISMSNAPTPFLVAGYWNISGNGLIVTTAPSYVFNASTSGTPVIANQTWTTSLTATDTNSASRPAYPDIATNGSGLVAVTPSNVYDGAYNSTTNSVNWTASISSFTEIFGCVTSDGGSNWVIVAKTGTAVVSYERSGNAGAWTRRVNSTGFITNPSSMTTTRVTLGYVNGYYVYGQYAAAGAYCNVLYRTVTGTAWRFPATPPTLDEVYRFATSNTTIVAVGYGTSPSYNPMSYSTSLTAWTSPTLPAWLSATASTYVYDIAYGGGMWVMVGMAASVGSFIAYSPDLSNWVQYIPTTPSGVQSLATWSWVSLTFNGNAWTIAGTYYTTGPYYHSGILTLDAGQWPNQTSKVAVDTMVPSGYLNPVSRIVATAFSNTSSFSGTVSSSVGPLTFVQPTQPAFTLYQYVPYDITVQATGASGFKYYYAFGVPVGFQFTPETTGTTASITGISPSNGTSIITLYAKTASSTASATQVRLNTVIPFFVNPQSGAGAYTAIVREHVDADAAQNARDNRTFPQVDSLAGPFMAPRAPDVVTQSNCFLGLCKKPCPTCRTMM